VQVVFFLGSSEVIDDLTLFSPISRPHNIYQRQEVSLQERHLPMLPLTLPVYRQLQATVAPLAPSVATTNYGALHGQLLERYAPPSLLVADDYNIVHYSPGISRYLFQPAGAPTNHILQRVRDELRSELATLLFRAFERKEPGLSRQFPVHIEGLERWVTLGVWPGYESDQRDVVLVLFYERDEPSRDATVDESPHDATVQMLEEDLVAMRRRLQTMAEEFETSQEEMKASNEELQSINEELRSTAEELETSKEELQSINEELLTVNQENKNKVDELSQLNSDLQNLLVSTDIATLFLDRDLQITRFTPRVGELFNVMMSDRGRPLAHITHKLGYAMLIEDAETVLRTLVPIEREVSSKDGRSYLMRILPYRTIDDRIGGVVVTFVDITERVQHEQELQQLMESLDQRVTERTEQVQVLASQVLMAEQQVQERMAQVLHDDLQQVLYSARMYIRLLNEESGEGDSCASSNLLADLDGIIVQAVDLTRRLISDVAPYVLDDPDLAEVLTKLAERMQEMHGLTVHLEVDKIPPIMNDNVRLVVHQVVRELLFNIVKHAGVNEATVAVASGDDVLQIRVEDGGKGFDVASVLQSSHETGNGFGLAHARQRLNWLGGELRLESQLQKGTSFTIVVPLRVAQSPSVK
jgi:two-component system, chemotaxis family, CheB/CheR fusion protein